MTFLVNSTNTKGGGGLQVTDSICCLLNVHKQHFFVVVLSSYCLKTIDRLKGYENVKVFQYNIKNSLKTLVWGRDEFLDHLVEKYKVDAALTVFGPSRWNPKCPHLCGFARPQLVLTNSPFYKTYNSIDKLLLKVLAFYFKRCSNYFWTENRLISDLVKPILEGSKVYTVTNYYNQVFDQPESWQNVNLPKFNGTTLLTISSFNPHKNFPIMAEVCRCLQKNHPEFSFRFVITLDREQCFFITPDIESCFVTLGRVDVSACPSLYQQADIMFMPTLMECFSATYPEAMRMEVPIVTTDLDFAHGLCGDAACYYEAMNAEAAAEAIFKVATDKEYANKLTEAGKSQLKTFDNYEQRADKLIKILEEIAVK